MDNQQLEICDTREIARDVDITSRLPDHVLHHILSFLPVRDVVQTCVLSKRWKDFWCSSPSLNFDQSLFLLPYEFSKKQGVIDFFKFVDSVFLLRHVANLVKLRLSFERIKYDPPRVNAWIIVAIKHKLQSLDLETVYSTSFVLTSRIFSCPTLRELKLNLRYSKLIVPSTLHLPSLDSLHLELIKFVDNDQTNSLLSASSMLKTLVIENCYFYNQEILIISSPQLRMLRIKQDGDDELEEFKFGIRVSSPSLLSFELKASQLEEECSLLNLVTLDKVDICIFDYSKHLITMIEGLKEAQSINLSFWCVESCSRRLLKTPKLRECLEIPFYNLKRLKLEAGYNHVDIWFIKTFLKYSPHLETLLLENYKCEGTPSSKEPFEEEELWSDCPMPCLRLVKIQNFEADENQAGLVRLLLKNTTNLEKMSIVTAPSGDDLVQKRKLMKFGEQLLTYPRASPTVGILFILG